MLPKRFILIPDLYLGAAVVAAFDLFIPCGRWRVNFIDAFSINDLKDLNEIKVLGDLNEIDALGAVEGVDGVADVLLVGDAEGGFFWEGDLGAEVIGDIFEELDAGDGVELVAAQEG